MNKELGQKIVIKFTEKLNGEVAGNESAFTISGKEYKYINGPVIDKIYQVISVEKHPNLSDDKHLLLTLNNQTRFNNVIDMLEINYDNSKGNLVGRGGTVESFTKIFLPTDLVCSLDPSITEKFKVNASSNLEFIKVQYNKRYAEEKFTVSASANIVFTYVGVVNP